MRRVAPLLALIWSVAATAQVDFESSNLPIVLIDTDDVEIPDEPKIPGRMQIIDNGPGERNRVTDTPNDYDGHIGIEVRGATSQFFPKQQYGFETWDADGEDIDASLLGMPEEEDWVLYAPYVDKSLMRNVLAYQFARSTGRYASRTAFCEVLLNGEYMGVFVLMEKIKRDDNRVDINKLKDDEIEGDDLTGGYIIELDRAEAGWVSPYQPPYETDRRVFYNYDEPDADDIVPQQADYIRGRFTAFETAMASGDIEHPETGYPAYIDTDSFVDFMLVNELARNVDAYRLSTFFHKDKDSNDPLIHAGPVWDFNLGFGNVEYHNSLATDGFVHEFDVEWDPYPIAFWWNTLATSQPFDANLRARWAELREGPFHSDSLRLVVRSTAARLDEAQARNFERWPVLGEYVPPYPLNGETYAEEVAYLSGWLTARAAWLDGAFATAGEAPPEASGGIVLSAPSPNPVRRTGQIGLQVRSPQHVRVDLFDLQGRRVATLHDGPLAPEAGRSLSVDATTLAPGLYLLRALGETGTAVQRLAVAGR